MISLDFIVVNILRILLTSFGIYLFIFSTVGFIVACFNSCIISIFLNRWWKR